MNSIKNEVEATCTSEGKITYTASFNYFFFTTQAYEETIEKKEHEYDEGEITTSPNIYEDGVKTYHCLNCGASKNEIVSKVTDNTSYTLDALKTDDLTGVFTAKAVVVADKSSATIGIPLISKENLTDYPTYESPGVIQGAAVEYKKKTGPVSYEPLPGKELVAPL